MTGVVTRPATEKAPAEDFARFAAVRAWVFDLDNTLYPHHLNVFPQLQQRVLDYMGRLLGVSQEEALRIEKDFHQRYGATLRGLIVEHGVSPDEFLEYVHDIDHSAIAPDPALADAIGRLPGSRYIFTNGSRRHAERVAEALGVTGHFDDIFDIVWAGHLPKPSPETYARLLRHIGAKAPESAMFEDLARNLLVPDQLGMVTVLVVPGSTAELVEATWQSAGQATDHVDYLTDDLRGFLESVLAAIGAGAR